MEVLIVKLTSLFHSSLALSLSCADMLRLFEEVGEDTSSPSKPTRKSRRKSVKPARFIDSSSATKKAAPAKENFNKKKPTKNNKKKSKKSRK